MKRKAGFVVPKTVTAFAWTIFDLLGPKRRVLCHWASPSKMRMLEGQRPSPEAKIVRVRIVRERDWKRVIKLAKSAKQVKRGK